MSRSDEQPTPDREAARARALLEARARTLARPPVPARSPRDLVSAVRFRVGQSLFALEARFVIEALLRFSLVPLPRGPAQLLGVVSFRGEFLPVFDAGWLLGLAAPERRAPGVLLVAGVDHADLALAVDEVQAAGPLAVERHAAAEPLVPEPARRWFRGLGDGSWTLLDGGRLLHDPRLLVDERP